MSRKGYTIFQRGGTGAWYVAWTDGAAKRRTILAGPVKSVAHEVGRAKASESDRVRTGVVDANEAKASQSGRESVAKHLAAWGRSLRAKGNTSRHVTTHERRATALLSAGGCATLSEISGERVQHALHLIAQAHTPQTAVHYLTALRGFVRWCIKTDRLVVDPIRSVEKPRVSGRAFARRPFSDADLRKLLAATEARPSRCAASGPERAMYYRLMAYTGLRVSEAKSLTPESFDLSASPARVTVQASYSKRRRDDQLLIRDDLAGMLRPWLAGRPAGRPVFGFGPHSNLHRVFARDASAAGFAPGTAADRVGMHSLRRYFITHAVRSGGLAVAQGLARHSTPALTMSYADLAVTDHLRGLSGLPNVNSASDSASATTKAGKRRKRGSK